MKLRDPPGLSETRQKRFYRAYAFNTINNQRCMEAEKNRAIWLSKRSDKLAAAVAYFAFLERNSSVLSIRLGERAASCILCAEVTHRSGFAIACSSDERATIGDLESLRLGRCFSFLRHLISLHAACDLR